MSKNQEFRAFSADEAIAIYEDSMSYFMPATFEVEPAVEPESDVIVEYYEAA